MQDITTQKKKNLNIEQFVYLIEQFFVMYDFIYL
jgi:hypothetical protein